MSVKYSDLVQRLRGDIHLGRLAPGERLPSRIDLQQHFQTSPLTLQRAIDVLVQDGYLRTAGRAGTFIVEHPPHLSHYALVFFNTPDLAHSQFFTALRNEAAKLQQPDRHISAFYNINGHVDVADYQRLLYSVQTHRFAGVIFASSTYMLEGSPVLAEAGMPRVVISSPDERAPIPVVFPEGGKVLPMALDRLAAGGCTRVAIVTMAADRDPAPYVRHAQALAAARGLELPETFVHGVHPGAGEWAKQTTQLLMTMPASHRPDGLIITDDNLVEAATAGLLAAGIQVPRELQVVAHTNFPWPTRNHVPVIRLGFDAGSLLATCIARIDEQRRGETPPPVTGIRPQFEDEFDEFRN